MGGSAQVVVVAGAVQVKTHIRTFNAVFAQVHRIFLFVYDT